MSGLALAVAACVGVPCVLFFLLFRRWLFAALALVPPAAVFASALLLRQHGLDQALIASLFGTICALSLGEQLVCGISAGLDRRALVSSTSRFAVSAMGPVLASYLLFLCGEALFLLDWRDCAAIGLLFVTGFIAALAGNWLCAFFPFSEHFIARANAAREWRQRMLEQFFPEIEPRWAFSVTGIALVLGAVAVFGIRDAHVHWMMRAPVFFVAGFAFVFAGFAAVARDWRMAAALTLAAAFTGTLLLWALARRNSFPELFTLGAMLMLSSASLTVIAARTRQYVGEGDSIAPALAVAVHHEGTIAVALGLIVGSAGLFATAASAMLSPALVFAIASVFAALLLFPALAVAIHTLFPRYRTVDEVFGRR